MPHAVLNFEVHEKPGCCGKPDTLLFWLKQIWVTINAMNKFFNTAGPIRPDDHYHIPSLERIDWEEVKVLMASKKYFLLHAPRQTGKTSALLEMMETLNRAGEYNALYANIEGAQASRNDKETGISGVCSVIASAYRTWLGDERLRDWYNEVGRKVEVDNRLTALLEQLAELSEKPIVLFIDEADALIGDTLISLLRQIRAGYAQRPDHFPQTIVLCGLRDIKDYRIHRSDGEIITGGSAFNIKSESLQMGNFTRQEVESLYQQHSEETGQPFASEIFAELWEDTKGQPWLVNALAYEMTWKEKPLRDRSRPITLEHYQAARERLVQSRSTHLDQLADKLKEPRVHRVISTLLAGEQEESATLYNDDLQYLADLGLITIRPKIAISNRIYREIIPRELTFNTQYTIANQEQQWYLTQENRLDIPKLLTAFQQFFREHADSWIEKFDYKEAGPQLLIQAFLQRIINGGGRINREYGLGRKRTDLSIEWPIDPDQGYFGEVQRVIIELKILHNSLDTTIEKGVEQSVEYADSYNAAEVHLIIFNRNPEIRWDDEIWSRQISYQQREVGVWGC